MSTEQIDKLIDFISRNAKLLSALIEDLLVISRIEEKKIIIKRERFNLATVLSDVIRQINTKIVEKEMKIVTEIDKNIEVLGDVDRTGQIFRGLLDNAIKYSEEKSMINIYADDDYPIEGENGKVNGVIVHIQDSGRGIKKKDLPRIFDRFFRAEEVSDIQGTGLGLSIALELARLQGGDILVKSEYKKGSTFSVIIPKQ
ncbi:MAG: sensor histidine kinase [Candidatus Hodarchaeales archaeon]